MPNWARYLRPEEETASQEKVSRAGRPSPAERRSTLVCGCVVVCVGVCVRAAAAPYLVILPTWYVLVQRSAVQCSWFSLSGCCAALCRRRRLAG